MNRIALIRGPAGLHIGSHGGEMGGTFAATLLTWLPAAMPTPPEMGGGRREGATDVGHERQASPVGCPLAGILGIRRRGSRIARLEGLDEGRVNPERQQVGRRPCKVAQIGQHAGQAKRTDGPMSEVRLAINSPVASNSIVEICGDRVDDPWQQLVAPASQRQWGRHGKVDLTWRRSPRGRSAVDRLFWRRQAWREHVWMCATRRQNTFGPTQHNAKQHGFDTEHIANNTITTQKPACYKALLQ